MTREAPTTASLAGGMRELLPLALALVLGLVVGVIFGRSMWIAGEGPEQRLARLDDIHKQKLEQREAIASTDPDRAESLSQQLVRIEQERETTSQAANEPKSLLAGIAWRGTKFLGDIFLQALKLLVLPLVATSMICGIAALGDIRRVGRMGGVTLFYFATTTFIAVLIGLALVTTIRPGAQADDTFSYVDPKIKSREKVDPIETILELVTGQPGDPGSGMVPSNIFQAGSNMNVLGIIVFSLLIGAALTTIGERGKLALDLFNALNEAILQIVRWVMKFAPVGIFGLVTFNIASRGGGSAFAEQVSQLGWYVMTIASALLLQSLLLLAIVAIFCRRNPITFLVGMGRALLTAFSTASSSATLPLSIECCLENGISRRSSEFVLPLGATVNMNGTALYEGVAVVFIAQSLSLELSWVELFVVALTATLAAVGAAGIPEAGLVTMILVLTAVGLPTSGIGTILSIDWFLDRMRTTVNVFGDMVGAAFADRAIPPAPSTEGPHA